MGRRTSTLTPEILSVVIQFKTAIYFIFMNSCHAMLRMNLATIETTFNVWRLVIGQTKTYNEGQRHN